MTPSPTTIAAPSRSPLPDLPTPIGLAGTMRHAEVAGAASLETGVLIAILVYSVSDQ